MADIQQGDATVPPTTNRETLVTCWKQSLSHYADFKGCASRAEFWSFLLLLPIAALPAIVGMFLNDIPTIADQHLSACGRTLSTLIFIGLLLPMLGVTIRRLHDTGKSSAWIFILLIPFGIGTVLFGTFVLQESRMAPTIRKPEPPLEEKKQTLRRFVPFYLYWGLSLNSLNTCRGRARRTEFMAFILLSLLFFLPLGFCLIDSGIIFSASVELFFRELTPFLYHPHDFLILMARCCLNPSFFFFNQVDALSSFSFNVLIIISCLNIMFNLPVCVRRLHDINLNGTWILLPLLVSLVTLLGLAGNQYNPEWIAHQQKTLELLQEVFPQISLIFLAMMLTKGSPRPNKYGVRPDPLAT